MAYNVGGFTVMIASVKRWVRRTVSYSGWSGSVPAAVGSAFGTAAPNPFRPVGHEGAAKSKVGTVREDDG